MIVIRRPAAARGARPSRTSRPRSRGCTRMRRLLLIGIGAGDPEYVTAQAIRALNEVDVFFVVEKGEEKHDLVDLRREICERYIERPSYRTVEMRDPERDRTSPAYGEAVEAWRHARAELYEATMRAELGPGRVRRDPRLGRSRALRQHARDRRGDRRARRARARVRGRAGHQQRAGARGAAPHRAQPRRAADPHHDGPPARRGPARRRRRHRRDARRAAARSGASPASRSTSTGAPTSARRTRSWSRARVADVADEIERVRAEARERKGWIMDTYLLRRALSAPTPG